MSNTVTDLLGSQTLPPTQLCLQAGKDAQAAARQAADARTEAQAAESEAGMQRAAAETVRARERQLQDSVKRLTADVDKWRAAAQATQDRLRSSSVAAGAADGDAREAKDALQVLPCMRQDLPVGTVHSLVHVPFFSPVLHVASIPS